MDGLVRDARRATIAEPAGAFFRPGENCWRVERSNRLAFLVDGDAFFSAAISALSRAERRIIILGWDFGSDTCLRPNRRGARRLPIGEYLLSLAQSKPELEIYILIWWGSIFYGANQDLPINFGDTWLAHPRIHYCLDDHHPLGASHHQKVISIDDKVAFVGGMDLTQCRWDDDDHIDDNVHRCDSSTAPYGPVHDVQTMFDGDAARAIFELAAERWRIAAAETLKPVHTRGDPWPFRVHARARNHPIAIARSQPPLDDQPEAREIETLNMEMLRAARRLIYVEQQYYTIPAVNDVLCEQLQKPDGPEIVIVANDVASGWVEQAAMFENRDRLFSVLRRADRFRRLRTFSPVSRVQPPCLIKVHSKLMIVDDRLLRIGSSNFNQRSLGLDTECDIAIHGDTPAARRTIAAFAYRLLAEHLGTRPRRVAWSVRRHGSWIRAIDALNTRQRRLVPYPYVEADGEVTMALGSALLDPPRSIDLRYIWNWLSSCFRGQSSHGSRP